MRGAIAMVVLSALAVASAGPEERPALTLRPITLAEGVRDVLNPGGDAKKLGGREDYRRAKALGLDLAAPQPDPVVGLVRTEARLYYVFYKTVEEAFGQRHYVIQRIKKTERTWVTADAAPEETVTYQVEAFKLLGGQQKRADQHYGSYGIKGRYRREIVKEYEIGFGEVKGLCEGADWPFDRGILFKYLDDYGPERETFDAVRFERSVTWTLTVSLDAEGGYAVRAPELGIDLPASPTDVARTIPAPDAASRDLVLVRGVGLQGTADEDDLVAAYSARAGAVIDDVPAGKGNRNVAFAARIIANLKADGSLNSLRTRPGFAGRTAEGARVGDDRARILQLYGPPRRQYADADWWHYRDIGFWFDGRGKVGRMYVRRR